MKPIVLIHGYSSESPTADPTSIANIYGDLPQRLRDNYDVVEIDLSRYISLNDSVSIADIARALNRALLEQHPELLKDGFHVVIHSTGARDPDVDSAFQSATFARPQPGLPGGSKPRERLGQHRTGAGRALGSLRFRARFTARGESASVPRNRCRTDD